MILGAERSMTIISFSLSWRVANGDLLRRKGGLFQVYRLPSMDLVFSHGDLAEGPPTLEGGEEACCFPCHACSYLALLLRSAVRAGSRNSVPSVHMACVALSEPRCKRNSRQHMVGAGLAARAAQIAAPRRTPGASSRRWSSCGWSPSRHPEDLKPAAAEPPEALAFPRRSGRTCWRSWQTVRCCCTGRRDGRCRCVPGQCLQKQPCDTKEDRKAQSEMPDMWTDRKQHCGPSRPHLLA